MTFEIADPRVEYIMQSITSKKHIADYPETPSDLWINPKTSQISYSVNGLLLLTHSSDEFLKEDAMLGKKTANSVLIFFYERYNAFPKIFRNIFSLILESPF